MAERSGRKPVDSDRRRRQIQLLIIYIVSTILIALLTFLFVKALISDKEELRDKGIAEFKAGNYEKAIEYFNESLNEKQLFSKKMDLDTKMYLGTAEIKCKKYADAVITLEELKKENEGTLDFNRVEQLLQFARTMSGYGKEDPESLIPDLEVAASNGSKSVYILLAACYYNTGNYEKMINAYKEFTNEYGMTNYVAYQLSSYYLRLNDYDTAANYIKGAPYGDDDLFLPELLYNEVLLYENKKDYNTAIEKMAAVYEMEPENEEFKKEYDFLYTRLYPNTDPVNKEDID